MATRARPPGAIAKEQAAQRDELLAKTADEVSRAAGAASGDARQKDLTVAGRASRAEGARIAAENLRRAIAARVAAATTSREVHRIIMGASSKSAEEAAAGSVAVGTGGEATQAVLPVPRPSLVPLRQYGGWSRYHTLISAPGGTDSRC
jgi:hypothetical protein